MSEIIRPTIFDNTTYTGGTKMTRRESIKFLTGAMIVGAYTPIKAFGRPVRHTRLPTAAPLIDWANLRNPILEEPDMLLKDPSVVFKDGLFYIFTHRNYLSSNLKDFKRIRHTGSQPDVTWSGSKWVMAKNGGKLPDWKNGSAMPRWLTSSDLVNWTVKGELLPGLSEERNIDPALAWSDGFVFVGLKRNQQFYITRMEARNLGTENYEPLHRASAGGLWAEQFQFIKVDGLWRLIATARRYGIQDLLDLRDHPYTGNHHAFIYTKSREGSDLSDWTTWVGRRELKVPVEDWNSAMHANGAFLLDLRAYDGRYYLFYAGSRDHESFDRRGHGKIGVVRSRRLTGPWRVPGDMG